jgi:hypothetical protein
MKLEIPPNPDGLPYFELDFAGCKLTPRWISEKEKDRLAPDDHDAHFDMAKGIWTIRTETGDRRGSPKSFPFGPTQWEFVIAILIAAAEYVYPPSQIDVYAMFYRIQKAFGKPPERRQKHEDHKQQQQQNERKRSNTRKSTFWFEVERNPAYRVRLNPARSYRIITNAHLDGLSYAIDNQ